MKSIISFDYFFPDVCRLERIDKQSTESLKLQFSESLRRTQENIAKCTICCFSSDSSEKPEDVYAQEMYATEIETLKKTIKEVSFSDN